MLRTGCTFGAGAVFGALVSRAVQMRRSKHHKADGGHHHCPRHPQAKQGPSKEAAEGPVLDEARTTNPTANN